MTTILVSIFRDPLTKVFETALDLETCGRGILQTFDNDPRVIGYKPILQVVIVEDNDASARTITTPYPGYPAGIRSEVHNGEKGIDKSAEDSHP